MWLGMFGKSLGEGIKKGGKTERGGKSPKEVVRKSGRREEETQKLLG